MACPSGSTLDAFAKGARSAESAAAVREHVAQCSACAHQVALLLPLAATYRPPIGDLDTLAPPTDADGSRGVEPARLARGAAIGRYLVLAPIGSGGMGVVYLAYDPALDRRVALKLLRAEAFDGEGVAAGRARLMREAHAMAKLSHPNVVSIYDVGVFDDQVFLAMAFVEGQNLRAWLAERPRTWREIREVFLDAGRGLEAAHAVGMIHRDFKPDNVLISSAGRAQVTDFGLARAATGIGTPAAGSSFHPENMPAGGLLGLPLTVPGGVSGTPGYMAPEQARGLDLDARADQYSFCVSLDHALFSGRGLPSEPAPAWLRPILRRGMAPRPSDRFPAMTDLLSALVADPAAAHRRRLAWAGLAGLVAVSLLLATRAIRTGTEDVCFRPERRLDAVWNADVRQKLSDSLQASRDPSMAPAWAYAAAALDRYAAAWVDGYRQACRDTRETQSLPESALQLRLDCLGRQRLDLQAAVHALSGSRPPTSGVLVGMTSSLPFPAECSDVQALSVVAPPSSEQSARVEALQVRLAESKAMGRAGRSSDALRLVESVAQEARTVSYLPLEAEALEGVAVAQSNLRHRDEAIAAGEQAFELAEAARMDQRAAIFASLVVFELASAHRPTAEVETWSERAHQLVLRVGPNGLAEYYYAYCIGWSELLQGRGEAAVEHSRLALRLAVDLFGQDSPRTLPALNNLANSLGGVGAYDEKLARYRQALAGSERIFGLDSDDTRIYQSNIAMTLLRLHRLGEAHEAAASAVAGLPPGTDTWLTTEMAAVEAEIDAAQGQTADALQLAKTARATLATLHVSSEAETRGFLGQAFLLAGQPAAAIEEYDKICALLGSEPNSPDWVEYLRLGGAAYLAQGDAEKARGLLERALQLASGPRPLFPGWLAEIRFGLARALVATSGDHRRAAHLAQQARAELARLPDQNALKVSVDEWIAKHP